MNQRHEGDPENQNRDVSISPAWEYGIKMDGHQGEMIVLGRCALPIEFTEDMNHPETYEFLEQAVRDFILENGIITIRPCEDI